jgi:DNA-binding CsgD family transcriptional regulator
MEREAELARIDELIAGARARRGSTLVIEGDAGIGKTVLLRAARDRASSAVTTVLAARAGELESDLAFAAVRQLFEPILHPSAAREREELLTGAARLAAGPLGLSEDSDPAENPAAASSALHGLYWLTANLTERGPLAVCVDDLHWADEPSLRFLSYLSRRADELPLLICLAARARNAEGADELIDAIRGHATEVLEPQVLSPDGVAALVRRLVSESAERRFCAACARASGGNPFLLVEALKALRADGVQPKDAEADRVERLRPQTISRALLARIARLGPAAGMVARAIAVLGTDGAPRRVAALAELGPGEVAEAIDALRGEAILTPSGRLEFLHPMIRNAVYEQISEPARALAHLSAARLLEAEGESADRLTSHLLVAEKGSEPWVVERLRAAAASALARGAPEPAVRLLQRALAEPPPDSERAVVLHELGRARTRNGQLGDAEGALRSALELVSEPEARTAIVLELGQVLRLGEKATAGLEVARAERAAMHGRDSELALWLDAEIALACHFAEPAGRWVEDLARATERATVDSPAGRALRGLYAYVAAGTGSRRAAEVIQIARSAVPEGASSAQTPALLQYAASALAMAGELGEALMVADRGIEITRQFGDIAQFGFVSMTRSWIARKAGRVRGAEADARAALAACEESPALLRFSAAMLAFALIAKNDLDRAQAALEEHGLRGTADSESFPDAFPFAARARLRILRGKPREAIADLRVTEKLVRRAGFGNPASLEWRTDAAIAHLALGARDEAQRLAEEELELARAFGSHREIGISLRTQGLVQGGERGIDLLRNSVKVLRDSQAEIELAHSMVELGAALRRAGLRVEAREELRQGLDLSSRLGGLRIAAQGREELVAAGARPRRALLTGPDSLTASELRVARLAVKGNSNRDIAQALFVTVRTVEMHLSNAYRKLDIQSRDGLARALQDADAS